MNRILIAKFLVIFASKFLFHDVIWSGKVAMLCTMVVKRIIFCLFTNTTSPINLENLWFIYQLRRQNIVSDSSSIFVIQLYNKLMFSLVAANLRVWRHACNWQSCQVVSFMKNLFLEDELKHLFLKFSWDVCVFTLVTPIIMGGVVFTSPWL